MTPPSLKTWASVFCVEIGPSFLADKVASYDTGHVLLSPNTENAREYHMRSLHMLVELYWIQSTVVIWDKRCLIIFIAIWLFFQKWGPIFRINWRHTIMHTLLIFHVCRHAVRNLMVTYLTWGPFDGFRLVFLLLRLYLLIFSGDYVRF